MSERRGPPRLTPLGAVKRRVSDPVVETVRSERRRVDPAAARARGADDGGEQVTSSSEEGEPADVTSDDGASVVPPPRGGRPELQPPRRPVRWRLSEEAQMAWQVVAQWLVQAEDLPTHRRRQAGEGQTVAYPAGRDVNRRIQASMGPRVMRSLRRLEKCLAPGFEAQIPSRFQFNRNFRARPHRDNNGGVSILLVAGDFQGGQIHLGGRVYPVDLPLLFDGRQLHWVLPFTGTRVSLVIYYAAGQVPLSALMARGVRSHLPGPVSVPASLEVSSFRACQRAWRDFAVGDAVANAARVVRQLKHALRDVEAVTEAGAYRLKWIPDTCITQAFLAKAHAAGYGELDVLFEPFWETMAHADGPRRLARSALGKKAQKQTPQRLNMSQMRQCLTNEKSAVVAEAPAAQPAPPLLALMPRPPYMDAPWEFVRLWALADIRKMVSRLIIHPGFCNLFMPSPSRTLLPSVWSVVTRFFRGNRQRRLALVDAVTFFYQIPIPRGWSELLRVTVGDQEYCVSRLPMGATASVAVAQQVFTAVCGIPADTAVTDDRAAYIDGAALASGQALAEFDENAEEAGLIVGTAELDRPEIEFIGAQLLGREAAWRLRARRVEKFAALDVEALPEQIQAAFLLVQVARALAALVTFCIPLRSYPAIFDYLMTPRQPDTLVTFEASLRAELRAVRALAVQQHARRLRFVAPREPLVLAYADACTEGRSWELPFGGWGVGVVICFPGGPYCTLFAQSPWPAAWAGAHINDREHAALTFAILLALRVPRAKIIAHTDSTCALSRFNGRTRRPKLVGAVLAALRRRAELRGAEVRVCHIPGCANPVDAISRGPAQIEGLPRLPSTPQRDLPEYPETPSIGATTWAQGCRSAAWAIEDAAHPEALRLPDELEGSLLIWPEPPAATADLPRWAIGPALRRANDGELTGLPTPLSLTAEPPPEGLEEPWPATHGPAARCAARTGAPRP